VPPVLNYVTPALKSVRNIGIWNTTNYVHKHVENVLRNVVRRLGKQQDKDWASGTEHFHFFFEIITLMIYRHLMPKK
jgi:hypothetical protein